LIKGHEEGSRVRNKQRSYDVVKVYAANIVWVLLVSCVL